MKPRMPRVDPAVAANAIENIPSLKNLLKDLAVSKDFGVDETKSILLLSRFKYDPIEAAADDSSDFGENDRRAYENEEITDESVSTTQMEDSAKGGMSNHNRQKRRRLAMSFATLAAKPWKREKIVKEGAIPALIELSGLNDGPIQRSCAMAFSYLCKEKSIRAQMIREGAFAALVALSSSTSKRVKSDSCRAMCNLCMEDGFEFNAVRDGVTFAVVQISTACPEIMDICLKLVLNLSSVAYARLEEVTDVLIHFNSLQLTEPQQLILMQAMCNLAMNKTNQLRLIEDGCLALVENAIKSHSPSLRLLAAETVRNLTTDQRSKNKLVDHNIIATLVTMSRDESENIKRACVQAFYNLSKDTTCREKIVHGHAVSVIIKMSMEKFQNVEMGRTAARTLRVLCGDRNVAHLLIRDGIVKALMSLISKDEGMIKDDGVIRQYCAESICSLFQIGDVLGRLIDQGAVGVLVSLSQKNIDLITGEWCSFALFHLATNPVCPVSMYSKGILPCLIKLCKKSSSRSKYFCTAALAHITMIKEVDCSDAIPILVDMLKKETNPVTQKSCSFSLCNLTDMDENCCMILETGALEPVVELTQSNDVQTKMKCAAIISKLSLFKQYYYQFSADVLKVLLDLSCVDHTLTQRRVVLALSNLTQSQELRQQLLELHPIAYIISLATKPDENLRRGCVSIVCNLSYEAGSESAIIKAGVLPTLLITALVTSDKLQSKVICAKAIVNLMADPTLHVAMVKEGIIWGLSTLALLGNPELLKLCINAICTLSSDFAREILQLSTAVNTVIHAINQVDDLEIMIAGGRTLMNLLLQSNDKDESFRNKAVENMTNLVQCKNEEVSEISILCLCLASQSESCRNVIVSSGMLHMIDVSTIFSQKRVSFAYLTMFGNIANNPSMRTELLDNQCLSRFAHICASANPSLDMAVTRALYCLSCDSGNLAKLVDQNILSLLRTIWRNTMKNAAETGDFSPRPDSSAGVTNAPLATTGSRPSTQTSRNRKATASGCSRDEVLSHMIATIYNISTSKDCQASLVSQGAVKMMADVWELARDDYDVCSLLVATMLHLACGSVNTTRMIEDGCCEIVCFVTEHHKMANYAGYYFDNEVHQRCAAALRNLLIGVPNQQALVDAGAIESLCTMAVMSGPARLPLDHSDVKKGAKYVSIHDNCAAGLRSMTYNTSLREKLLATGAIKVLMSSMTSSSSEAAVAGVSNPSDELYIGHALLCELEAESWENGSRGKTKEGRAPQFETAPMYTGLLKGSTNAELEAERRHVELPKYTAQVHLEELPAEVDSEGITLELGIDDLASFEDAEETMASFTVYAKQECDVMGFGTGNTSFVGNPTCLRNSLSEELHDEDVDLEGPRVLALHSSTSHHSGGMGLGGDDGPGSSELHEEGWISPMASPMNSTGQPQHPTQAASPTAAQLAKGSSRVGFAGISENQAPGGSNLGGASGHPPFPPISRSASGRGGTPTDSTGMFGNGNHQASSSGNTGNGNTSLPQLNTTNNSAASTTLRVRKPPNESKKIKQLVAVIKQAKDGAGGANVDDILQKWGSISKF